MLNFDNLKHGDKIRCIYDGSTETLEVEMWRGVIHFIDPDGYMWSAQALDPIEWELVID